MRLPVTPNIHADPALLKAFRDIHQKVNQIASGSDEGFDWKASAAPTTGTWKQGDQIRHSAPVEAGTTPNKYVILGWVCVAGGTPGTWVQMRVLTGN